MMKISERGVEKMLETRLEGIDDAMVMDYMKEFNSKFKLFSIDMSDARILLKEKLKMDVYKEVNGGV